MIVLGGCQTTQYIQANTEDPIYVAKIDGDKLLGTPLSKAAQGGGALVRINPVGGAWLPLQNWIVVAAFADACRRDDRCFQQAATKVYSK